MIKQLKVRLTRFVCTDFSWPQLPVLEDRMSLPFSYREDIFHMGISSLVFKRKKEVQSVLASAVFHMPLTKWSICRVAYFGEHVLNPFTSVT